MTDGEKENQKQNSGRKKPFSCSQLLPLGVRAICGCIAKMPLPCARRKRKKLGAHLSEAEIEYVQITQTVGRAGHGVPSPGQHSRGS
eukprot:scaffold17184_cov47-Attheya_sp.AAC.2